MDKLNFNYSLKNTPLPNKDIYRKNLTQKVESFIKKIRWKGFFFERHFLDNEEIATNFGFKSVKTPPKNDGLYQFESDLQHMVQNIEFKKIRSNFQMPLSNDVKNIKKDRKIVNTS